MGKKRRAIVKRQIEAAIYFENLMWEMKGESERSMVRLSVALVLSDVEDKDRAIREQIQAIHRQSERLNRLLYRMHCWNETG